MELAVIISIIALLVALPSCIADSLIVISKVRAYFRNRQRTYKKPLILSKVLPLLKKASLFHLQKSVAVSCFAVLAITLFSLVSLPLPTVFAPTANVKELKALKLEHKKLKSALEDAEEVRKLLEGMGYSHLNIEPFVTDPEQKGKAL
jgi:branched-subunit amino acid permease